MLTNTGLLHIGGKDPNKTNKSKKLSTLSTIHQDLDDSEIRMKKTLMKNKHLISVDVDDAIKKANENKGNRKEIISYKANRDTLFIPHPERPIRPVDIRTNLIEEEKKKPIADIGLQCDEITYENMEKPFIPKKIGKDVGVQIEDGDLFNFDIDVEPLLKVLCGKILEQTDLELMEEAEIKNLSETKAAFIRKFKSQKEEIKKLEEEEIKRKKEFDDLRKRKRLEKLSKIDIQQKLVSHMFSKSYLNIFVKNSLSDLNKRGVFKNYSMEVIKDSMNKFNKTQTEANVEYNNLIEVTLLKLNNDLNRNIIKKHSEKIKSHKDIINLKKEEVEKIRQQDEERKKKEELEKQERKRLRRIKRIRESIRKTVFENPVLKSEYHLEDVSEIDNYGQEGPFVGIYGGLLGSFIITLSILRKSFFPQDQYYTQEIIFEILSNYLSESGNFNLYFTNTIEESIKESINKENLDLNNLKGNTELTPEDWIKLGDLLSDINLNIDHIMKFLLEECHEHINPHFYSQIIKSLCQMLEKGINLEKINFIFRSPPEKEIVEKIKEYEALCVYELRNDPRAIIDSTDFIKDKKKKPMKVPEFDNALTKAKLYQKNSIHNVLIYDKTAQFIIRNKILEESLRSINNELDTKAIFKTFNEHYDGLLSESKLFEIIQYYNYEAEEFVVSEN